MAISYFKSKSVEADKILELCTDNDRYHLNAGFIPIMPFEVRKYEVAFIAKDGDNIVGILTAITYSNAQLNIVDVFVRKNYRGKGVASKLLEIIQIYARRKGYKQIQVGCFIQNEAAYKLYSKLGFETSIVKMIKKL